MNKLNLFSQSPEAKARYDQFGLAPFAPSFTPTKANIDTPVPSTGSPLLDRYRNDSSISEEGKANLFSDIESGTLDTASAEEIVNRIYAKKEPGFLEGFAEKTAEAAKSSAKGMKESADKWME